MQHFVKHSHSSKDYESLLIFDNHKSYLTLVVITYAKSNGVIILTILLYCSGKLQSRPMDAWKLTYLGSTVIINYVPGIFKEAFTLALTSVNIISSFQNISIFPLN